MPWPPVIIAADREQRLEGLASIVDDDIETTEALTRQFDGTAATRRTVTSAGSARTAAHSAAGAAGDRSGDEIVAAPTIASAIARPRPWGTTGDDLSVLHPAHSFLAETTDGGVHIARKGAVSRSDTCRG